MKTGSEREVLGAVPMLAGLDDRRLDELAERTSVVHLGAGEHLFRAGDAGDSLYAVLSGRLQVIDADDEVIRELVPGEAVGELALITGEERSADVQAKRDSEVLRLGQEEFDQLLEIEPTFAKALLRAVGAHLRATREPRVARRVPATIALLPLEPSAPVQRVAAALRTAFAALGPTAFLDPDSGADAGTVNRLEDEHDRVVLVATSPATDDPWTAFCLGQADRIVALAAQPGRATVEPRLKGCDFVTVAPSGVHPEMSSWLEAVQPRATHVLRLGGEMAAGAALLARRLAGRSLGLVLSGGGARSFAHVGIVEELEQAGYVFDRFAGTSMGAMIGALLALGVRGDDLAGTLRREWVQRNPLGDRTVPLIALSRGVRALEMLERTFGTRTIESLDRDFFCCSCDLRTQQLVVHRRGPLATAVGGSMALPGRVPPMPFEDGLLIDGAVLNNLPVEPMAQMGEGPIVAVDVVGEMPPPRPARSRFPRVRKLIVGPGADTHPNMGETLLRTVLLGGAAADASARKRADVTIVPKLRRANTLQFAALDRMRDVGREAGREALDSGLLTALEERL